MGAPAASRPDTKIPGIGTFRLPLERNDLLILLVAFVLFGLGLETYLAHLISGSIKPNRSTMLKAPFSWNAGVAKIR